MSPFGPGRVKTKSDLVVALSGGGIFAFFCSERDHKPQIPGAVIPRRVFTRPGPEAAVQRYARSWNTGRHGTDR